MSSRKLIVGFFVALALFAIALWYFQTYAFYRDLPRRDLTIAGQVYKVTEWRGTHASSSPLKLRVCLSVVPETAVAIAKAHEPGTGAEPLVAPGWFDCFDAAAIGADLEAGRALAYALGPTESDGIDAWLALYPDGRGFLWHQLNARFARQ